jgi:hypothetical protein
MTEEHTDEWKDCQKTEVVEAKGPFTDPQVVNTMEGDYEVDEEYIEEHGGYYLMRGVEGEVYPCARDVFEQSYEYVEHHMGTTDGDEYEPGDVADAVFYFVQTIALIKKTIEPLGKEDADKLSEEDKEALETLDDIIKGFQRDDDDDDGNSFKVDDELY